MNPRLHPDVSLFKSSLYRDDRLSLPRMSRPLLEVSRAPVPPDLQADHCGKHLLSFAAHMQSVIDKPCESLSMGERKLYNLMGMVVLEKMTAGNFKTLQWLTDREWLGAGLGDIEPTKVPILDFPTSGMWKQLLLVAFKLEALQRIGDEERANAWSKWAWELIDLHVGDSINLNAVRHAIRQALELDANTVRLLRLRGHYEPEVLLSASLYNQIHLEQEELLALEAQAPILLPLWWGLKDQALMPQTGDAAQRLKRYVVALSGKPQVWRTLSKSGRSGASSYTVLAKEFFGAGSVNRNNDLMAILTVLGATRFPPLWWFRLVLSLAGTQANTPIGYANSIQMIGDSLRHVLRLITAMPERRKLVDLPAQTHAILRWLWDKRIKTLDRKQRRGGWAFLLQRADAYSELKQKQLSGAGKQWRSTLPQLEIAEHLIVPLTSGAALWEDAVDMKHCADIYVERCLGGRWQLFSVRDLSGRRQATVAYTLPLDSDIWRFVEVAGRANRQVSDDVLGAVASLSLGINIIQVEPPEDTHYAVYLTEHWGEPGEARRYGTYRSAQRAIEAAQSVCDAELESQDPKGYEQWCTFGDSAVIISLGMAPKVEFSGHEYMKQLCGIKNSSTVQNNLKESL